MSHLHQQNWRCRVAALLDDPVAQTVLCRDGLTRDSVIAQMEPIAFWLRTSTVFSTSQDTVQPHYRL
jgi:hypothetical protein